MRRICLCGFAGLLGSVITVALAADSGQQLWQGQGSKPAANPQATIAFLNGTGDKIAGDGTAYTGGVGNVVAEMQYPSITLNVAGTSGKNKRYLLFVYPPGTELATSCDPNPPIGPSTTGTGTRVAGYMQVKSLGALQVGEARAVRIHFGADTGQFLWLSAFNVLQQCSSVVAAYRADQYHWQVATTLERLTIPTGNHGIAADGTIADAELNWVHPSDVAELQLYSGNAFAGNYRLPFGLTIYCPTCSLSQTSCPSWQTSPCAIPKN